MRSRHRILAALLGTALVLAACASGAGADPGATGVEIFEDGNGRSRADDHVNGDAIDGVEGSGLVLPTLVVI